MPRSVAEKVPQPGPHPPTCGPRELAPSGGVGLPKVRPGAEAPLGLPDGQAPGVEGGGQALGRCQGSLRESTGPRRHQASPKQLHSCSGYERSALRRNHMGVFHTQRAEPWSRHFGWSLAAASSLGFGFASPQEGRRAGAGGAPAGGGILTEGSLGLCVFWLT